MSLLDLPLFRQGYTVIYSATNSPKISLFDLSPAAKHLAVHPRLHTRGNQPVKFGLTKIIIFGSYFFQS